MAETGSPCGDTRLAQRREEVIMYRDEESLLKIHHVLLTFGIAWSVQSVSSPLRKAKRGCH